MNDSYLSFVNAMLRRIAPETNGLILDVYQSSKDGHPTAGKSTDLFMACEYFGLALWRQYRLVFWACRPSAEDVEHQRNAFEA